MFSRQIYNTKRQGVTLLELVFVIVIGSVVAIGAASVFIFGSRLATATSTQTRLNAIAQAKIERIKNEVRGSRSFTVTDVGNRLNITALDGGVSSYFYFDDDATTETMWNNRLMLDPASGEAVTRVASWIDRTSGEPLFSYAGGSSPLEIRIRLGEPVGGSRFNFTGTGTQALDVVTSVTSRNEGL